MILDMKTMCPDLLTAAAEVAWIQELSKSHALRLACSLYKPDHIKAVWVLGWLEGVVVGAKTMTTAQKS